MFSNYKQLNNGAYAFLQCIAEFEDHIRTLTTDFSVPYKYAPLVLLPFSSESVLCLLF